MIIIVRDVDATDRLPYPAMLLAETVITEGGEVIKNRFTNRAPDPVALADALSTLRQCLGAE